MAKRRSTAEQGTPGSRFTLIMAVILLLLLVLVFSIRNHVIARPNSGPNQQLHP